MPVNRAAAYEPPNLPSVATATMSAQMNHSPGPETRSSLVRMPANAKNAGRSRMVTRSFSLSPRVRATAPSCGMTAPNRNAPKMACTPIHSVVSADSSIPASAAAMIPFPGATASLASPRSAGRGLASPPGTINTPAPAGATGASAPAPARLCCPCTTNCTIAGRTTVTISVMKASVDSTTTPAPCSVDCATPTTTASRHHAVTSSTAAQVRAMVPSSLDVIRRSARILASTGNAVIDIATPMNSAKLVNGTPLGASRGYRYSDSSEPSTNGATMLAWDVRIVDSARWRKRSRFKSRPTMNM